MTSHAMRAIPSGWAGTLLTKDFAVGHSGTVGMWVTGDEVVRIQDGRGLLLCVKSGSAWVTQAGSIKDVFIGAGETFRLERDGRTLVSRVRAGSNMVITLTRPARPAPAQGPSVTFLAWIDRGLAFTGLGAGSLRRVAP